MFSSCVSHCVYSKFTLQGPMNILTTNYLLRVVLRLNFLHIAVFVVGIADVLFSGLAHIPDSDPVVSFR